MDRLRRRRRPQIPGAGGDSFQRPGQIPGGSGQFTLFDTPFSYIADPRDLANLNGLGGVFGVPDFLWVAGDGNTPTIGPALSVTGTPEASTSPWQLVDSSDVATERYDGLECRHTATVVDPAAGQDLVIFCLAKKPPTVAGVDTVITNRTSGAGWLLYYSAANAVFFVDDGVVQVAESTALANSSYNMLIAIADGDGNMYLVVNGTPTAGSGTPAAGAIGSGDGLGIAAYPSQANKLGAYGEVVFGGAVYGNGIADAWISDSFALAQDFTCLFAGVCPVVGDITSFSRASVASWEDHNGIWHTASDGLPRSGDSGGLRTAPVRTNKSYNTINPQATTSWGSTGGGAGVRSVQDDSAFLTTYGLLSWGPNVMQYASDGSVRAVFNTGPCGNVNAHCLRVFVRGVAGGETVSIGLINLTTGAFQLISTHVMTTAYTGLIANGVIPSAANSGFALQINANQTIRFIAPQLEEGAVATTPIPNWATAATATRAAEILQTSQPLPDTQGSVDVQITPMGWSGGEGGDSELIERTGAAALLLYPASGGTYQSDDSASTVVGTYAPVDGVETQNRVRWATSGELSLSDDSGRVSTAYSGSLKSTGDLKVESSTKEVAIRDLRVYRNGDG